MKKIKNVRTLNISISDMEFNHLGIKNENITFHEFTELVKREVMRNNLINCISLAEKYGLLKQQTKQLTWRRNTLAKK